MRRFFAIPLLVFVAGCGTLTVDDGFWQRIEDAFKHDTPAQTNKPPVVVTNAPPVVPPVQPPADPAAEPNPARPQDQKTGFLWKPSAEGGGDLVVLCPPAFTGHIKAWRLEVDGRAIETGTGAGVFNGGRYHIRYSQKGGEYPPGVTFALVTDAGRVWRWKIPNPASRYDGQIVPTVTLP